ncbi:unnamed protein product [Discosporangium mesarthrocarpum]
MCICLNCSQIRKCQIYSIIEIKHKEKKIKQNYIFFPQSPVISINLFYQKKLQKLEWDVIECLSYEEEAGSWLLNSYNKIKLHRYSN